MRLYAENLTNVLYRFTLKAVEHADPNGSLIGAEVQTMDMEKVQPKTVRISRYESDLSVDAQGNPKEFNAAPVVEFLVLPESQSSQDLFEARETAHQMAMEFYAAMRKNSSLGGAACRARITGKINGYRNIANKRYQASILEIVINEDGRVAAAAK